jgi:hypothetical protein
VVAKSARDRSREGTSPLGDSGRWTEDLGTGGFGHYRFIDRGTIPAFSPDLGVYPPGFGSFLGLILMCLIIVGKNLGVYVTEDHKRG